MIRHMLQRGYLMSSQLYVTWSHTEEMVGAMLVALDESLGLAVNSQERRELQAEAGVVGTQQGFARFV